MPQLEMPFDAVHWCEYKSCLIFIEFSKYDVVVIHPNIQNHANSTPLWLALCESFIQIYPQPCTLYMPRYLYISFVLHVMHMLCERMLECEVHCASFQLAYIFYTHV